MCTAYDIHSTSVVVVADLLQQGKAMMLVCAFS